MAVSGAPDVGVERPVPNCVASGDPVFCLVKEPTTLFV